MPSHSAYGFTRTASAYAAATSLPRHAMRDIGPSAHGRVSPHDAAILLRAATLPALLSAANISPTADYWRPYEGISAALRLAS